MALSFRCASFDELTPRELYGVLAARERVFVEEQRCPYVDADGFDPLAIHVWAMGDPTLDEPSIEVAAYLRFFGPGVRFEDDGSLGRVLILPELRGRGLGRELVAFGMREIERRFGSVSLRIAAQSHLVPFYESFGFARIGADYLELGLPHTDMRKPSP